MESKAILKYARCTPRKARRVVDLIRGKKAGDALLSLKFMPYRGARYIEKILKSAMHNAEQKNNNIDSEALVIKAFVDEGSMMKRVEQRSMGRANVIKKKSCHITVILTEE
ncbi:MAG: 50S ribosomal protein L22 [Nitrospiraceae bacterium]|jgi:large subunit ribosomal protein L22|nr:MAG: 50S ribosomal protein L22 [Nitrospiraceae bacterium]